MKNNIVITIQKELRTTVRDRKSLLMMLVLPILIPIIIFVLSYAYDVMLNDEEVESYMVGINYDIGPIEQEIINHINMTMNYYGEEGALQKAYENNEIAAYVIQEGETYKVYYNPKNHNSYQAGLYAIAYLEGYSNYLGQMYLMEEGIDPSNVFQVVHYESEELKGSSDLVDQIVLMAFVFAIMSVTLTAIYSATDSIAGEKERGTLETILTFPIESNQLIVGKYLANLISCIITVILCIVVSFASLTVAQNFFSIYDEVVFVFDAATISLAFVILFGHALFVSGVTIAIASFSKSYKEAQSALTPLSLASMIPMFLNIMGVEMSPLLAAIPIVNHTLLLNEIFTGNMNLLHISIMLVSTIVCVMVVIIYIIRLYKSEKILFST